VGLGAGASGCPCNTAVGDPSQPAQLELTAGVINSDGTTGYALVGDGGTIELVHGGQGFLMVAMNVLARNVDACNVQISGRLRQPSGAPDVTNQVKKTLVDIDAGGWAGIDGSFGAVVTLPPQSPGYGLWELDGSIVDGQGHAASATASFVMACNPLDTYCACTVLNPPMPQCDAGVDAG
jgi:hypothetical protein